MCIYIYLQKPPKLTGVVHRKQFKHLQDDPSGDPGVIGRKPAVKVVSQHDLCSGSATEQLSSLLKHFPGYYTRARKTSVLIREL